MYLLIYRYLLMQDLFRVFQNHRNKSLKLRKYHEPLTITTRLYGGDAGKNNSHVLVIRLLQQLRISYKTIRVTYFTQKKIQPRFCVMMLLFIVTEQQNYSHIYHRNNYSHSSVSQRYFSRNNRNGPPMIRGGILCNNIRLFNAQENL